MTYTQDDFIEFFLSKGSLRSSKKRVQRLLSEYLKDVDPSIIDLIMKKTKDRGLRYTEASNSSGCFSSYFKTVNFPVRDGGRETAFHELGHAIDFVELEKITEKHRSRYQQHFLSTDIILSGGKTLYQVVRAEINDKRNAVFDFLAERFNDEVLKQFGEHTQREYLLHRELMLKDDVLGKEYKKSKKNESQAAVVWEKIRKLWDGIHAHGDFTEVVKEVEKSVGYENFKGAYSTLIDMLSGVYDLKHYYRGGHSRSYMNRDGGFGVEFFADIFASEVTGNKEDIVNTRTFLPKSYRAYSELVGNIKDDVSKELGIGA
jgi:hypothetical protein